MVFFGATVLHACVFMGLYVLLDLRQFGAPYAAVAGQALGNAVVGVRGVPARRAAAGRRGTPATRGDVTGSRR